MDTDKYTICNKHAQDVMVWLKQVSLKSVYCTHYRKTEQSQNL